MLTVFDYSSSQFRETTPDSVSLKRTDSKSVTWINVDSIKDQATLDHLASEFNIHPLVIEDIVHTSQRPKVEDYDSYLYIVVQMLDYNSKLVSEQVSIILGKNYVITFQEKKGDIFDNIRERIRKDKGKVRRMGADFLAYSILDSIVDHYFVLLEKLGDKVGKIEDELITNPSYSTLHKIQKIKKQMTILRRSVWPMREVVNALDRESREKSPLVSKGTTIYLRDLYDHSIQVIDTLETYRDLVSGMVDMYLSSISNKLNEVMKVLTVISTIFIPLTFITGLYGMNFKFMPELEHPLGYFAVLAFMLAMAVTMFIYFRRKAWI